MSNKRNYVYWLFRRRKTCPDCGLTEKIEAEFEILMERNKQFICPRCGALYSEQEFWEEQEFKWSRTIEETVFN